MHRSNFAIFPTTFIAAAALLVGCDLEQSGEPETQAIELLEIGEEGEGCLVLGDRGAMECFQTEDEADAQLLASLPADESAVEPEALAPSCVTAGLDDRGWTDKLYVFNGCLATKRVKVVLAYGTDLPCYTYSAKTGKHWAWDYPKRFDKLVLC